MKIGIISECQRQDGGVKRSFFFKKPFCAEEIIDEESNGFCIVAVQLPYTLQQLQTVSDKKRLAAMRRACGILLSHGVRSAVYTAAIKEIFTPADAQGIRILREGDLFCRLLPDLVRRLSKKCRIDKLSARLGISDAGLSSVAQRLIYELCYDARYVKVFTADADRGEEFAQRLSEELGMPVAISGMGVFSRCDILIDLDKREVRVGRDVVVDGIALDFEVGGYEVDTMEMASGLDIPITFDRVKYVLSGKKKLTL